MTDGEMSFEQALADLESIADSLEQDDLDLDQALTLFKRGVERLRAAGLLLDEAHGKVEELVQEAADSWTIRPMEEGQETGVESGSD